MSKLAIGIGAAVVGIVVFFFILQQCHGSLTIFIHFSGCLNLSVGITEQEVKDRMQEYLDNSDYKVTD
jgi:hypothetical protein